MAKIQTVRGEIDPQELGITYGHEHLVFRLPEPYYSQDPDLSLDDPDAALQESRYFYLAGGRCLVEMSTPDINRSAGAMLKISEQTGIHIVAATGFNKNKYCEAIIAGQPVEQIAEGLVRDLTLGMDGTTARAGLIKAASSLNAITPAELKVFQAAIVAHQRTGAPISTHTEAGSMAYEQVRILADGGVQPDHILISHLDRKLEWEYILGVARQGVFIGFDQIGKEQYFPDALRIATIKKLIEAGHGGQIVLAGDMARKSYWPSYGFGKGPGLTYILWRFVPWMLEEGVTQEAVDDMLIRNPARFLQWAH